MDPAGVSRKATGFLTNCPVLARPLRGHLRDGSHDHARLEGGDRARRAQEYPAQLVQLIAKSIKEASLEEPLSFPVDATEELEGDEATAEEPPLLEGPHATPVLEPKVRAALHKAHVNLGHPSKQQFSGSRGPPGPEWTW